MNVDRNLTDTINAMKESFFTIINNPEIMESFIESMGLQDLVDDACKDDSTNDGVKVELVKEDDN